MKRRTGDWKRAAGKALSGRYLTAIAGMIAVEGITFLSSVLAGGIFQGTSVVTLIIYQAATFIVTLIMSVFYAGLSYMYLNMARNREYSLRDLLYLFSHQPDRIIAASFVLTAIDLAASLPYLYASYTAPAPLTMEEMMMSMQHMTNLMLGSLVLGTILKLPFEMAYFLMTDDLEMGGMEALRTSFAMMKGHMLKYLILQISFIPLAFLAVLTLGIGLLWLVPYMLMTTAFFYLDLKGEFHLPGDVYENPPLPGHSSRDDYNSEA